MVYEIRLPELEDDAEDAAIVAWTVKAGTQVEAGDVLCEIEAGKAVHQVASPADGTLRVVLQDEGTLLAPGALLAIVAEETDDISSYETQ